MKELGVDHWATPSGRPKTADPEADKPTLVVSPQHLLDGEWAPQKLSSERVDESLLDLESDLSRAADIALELPVARAAAFEDDAWSPRARSGEPSHIGEVIDNRYVVEALIARGGMGIVYRCRHQLIDRKFAVKIIRSTMAHLPDAPRRFLIEAKAASAIGNEHIVDVVDYGTLGDGSAYLVMELLEGMPLSDIIARHELLPIERIASIASQVCEGLCAAHAAGIVHRDLKPENIFLSSRKATDFVKILDFGIAKMLTSSEALTKKGLIVGTPHYMSPEQAAGAPVDPRGDIYSLGVILYELATGRVPFDATHYMAVLAKHMTEAPPAFVSLSLPAQPPPDFEEIVLKCLEKRPEQRYQSMNEVMEATERLSQRLRVGAQPSLPPALEPPEPQARDAARISGAPVLAAGRSVPAGERSRVPPRAGRIGMAVASAALALSTGLSLWRVSSPEALDGAASPEAAAPLEPPPPPPSLSATQAPLTPASPSAPTGAAPIAPGTESHGVEEPPSASLRLDPAGDDRLTVVQLGPGKSVEIEARTRLSLRLSPEVDPLAAPPPGRDAPRPARKSRPAKLKSPPKAEPPPEPRESNGLMNPWPAPAIGE